MERVFLFVGLASLVCNVGGLGHGVAERPRLGFHGRLGDASQPRTAGSG